MAGEPVLVGRSKAILSVLATIDRVAPASATVLITGESGTGKELVARLIHRRSSRDGPLVVVNCPALPATLIEAELFGIEKGVATGVDARPGRLEAAQGGTLLLDEIGDLTQSAQAEILRFVEEKTVERLGSRKPVPVDVRILAATNHDLKAEIERGAFRRDLYHRLNTVGIHVPPLREHREDIPDLVAHFLGRAGSTCSGMSFQALDLLLRYDYPGNVRELERILEGAELLARGPVLLPRDLPEEVRGRRSPLQEDPTLPLDPADLLHRAIVRGEGSFWDLVREPYLARQVPREVVERLIERAYHNAGGSYRMMARLFHIEPDLRRLLNFLYYHKLHVRRDRGKHREPPESAVREDDPA